MPETKYMHTMRGLLINRASVLLALLVLWEIFFFSSRRRHPRSKRDWSSDGCSSDLHRHVRRWIVRKEDPRAASRQEPVEDFHPPFVLVCDAGQILPLPPRRPVQAADAPDDADAPRRRLEDRRLVLQETHPERVGESGDIRRMVAGVFVV